MQVVLNIGMVASSDGVTLRFGDIIADARMLGIRVHLAQVFPSDSEPTVVMVAELPHDSAAHDLALVLDQDCIAVYDYANGGRLIGPRADAWGEFNPAFFILPDGSRLSARG